METLPGDDYNGYHAMALTACMGMGDKDIVGQLPTSVPTEAVCLAGLRECEYPYLEKRVEELGLTHYSPQQLARASQPMIDWLGQIKSDDTFRLGRNGSYRYTRRCR